MTNESICAMIQTEPEDRGDLLRILWGKVYRLLHKIAGDYYARNVYTCKIHGVELDDLKSICYEVYLKAVDAYKPDDGAPLVAYFGYTFKNAAAELLGIRTERGRREPLNHCISLDAPADPTDPDGATLGDLIADPDGVDPAAHTLDEMNREEEAAAVHAAVDKLPDMQRRVIALLFFEGKTLAEAGELLGVSAEGVRQHRQNALRTLRRSALLRGIYEDNRQYERQTARQHLQTRPDYAALHPQHRTAPKDQREQQRPAVSCEAGSSGKFLDELACLLGAYLPTAPADPDSLTLRAWAERERQRRQQQRQQQPAPASLKWWAA